MTSLIWLILIVAIFRMAESGTIAASNSASRNAFAADIFNAIALERPAENIIFSPASIQSCLTLAFFGAMGETESEMRSALRLGENDASAIAQDYSDFLRKAFESREQSNGGPQLKMANRIYITDKLDIAPEFAEIAVEYFRTQAQKLNFSDSERAAKDINKWVESATEQKITNLLPADAIGEDTGAVLVNAIYFKGLWQHPFSEAATSKREFSNDLKTSKLVDMMYMEADIKYAKLENLAATAIELPYNNSDLSMLIILPRIINGLQQLEQKLLTMDLNDITQQMQVEEVDVFLPKFRIEFEIDLKQPLEKLGMRSMFSNNANFSKLFSAKTQPAQKASEVRHKAFLDVNEAGSEAAAATFYKISLMSLNLRKKTFHADHPFFFAIRDSHAVYFAGHVAQL